MTSQTFIQSNRGIPDTHNFIYKSKKFPFKFDFFKWESSFFKEHQEEMQKIKEIDLITKEEQYYIEFTEYSIQCFINYVQSKQIPLDNENVIAINYLSKKYGIPNLYEETLKYISDHHSDLILPILLSHQQDFLFDNSNYENIISDHLEEYLEDNRLSKLPISQLHRIIFKNRQINQNEEKIINFLFKCLDEHGRSASILFSNFDFSGNKIQHLIRLQNDYNSVFDFSYINSAIIKSLIINQQEYEKQINLLKKEIEYLKSPFGLEIQEFNGDCFIQSQENHLFLDVENGSKNVFGRIIVSKFHGGQSQKWRKEGSAIYNVNSNLVLDIEGGESVGTDLIQHYHHGWLNQQWNWCNGTIRSPEGYCIEINNTSSIITANYSGNKKQMWKLYYKA